MSDAFTSAARDQRSILERLIKGLPGISGYTDKELRRNADYRLRQLIADELDGQRNGLLDVQGKLLKGGGLAFLDDIDVAVTRLGTLVDRVRTASYGYAGFFDAVRIRKEELDALHRFDVALMENVATIEAAVSTLRQALADKSTISGAIDQVVASVDGLTQLFDRRSQAITSPELLTNAGYAPEVRTAGFEAYDLQTPDESAANQGGQSGPSSDVPPGFELINK